jgi:hypothetical protein
MVLSGQLHAPVTEKEPPWPPGLEIGLEPEPDTVKVKGKVVPVFLTEHHAMKAYWGSGGIAPLILWPRH